MGHLRRPKASGGPARVKGFDGSYTPSGMLNSGWVQDGHRKVYDEWFRAFAMLRLVGGKADHGWKLQLGDERVGLARGG